MNNKEVISDKQGIALIILFLIGEASILLSGATAGRDLWIATILATILFLPMIFVYIQLFKICPDKTYFDLLELCYGKVLGKVFVLLYFLYAFDIMSLVLRDFGQFVNTVSFPETSFIIPVICIMLLCIWIVKEGIEVIGRFAEFFVAVPIIFTIMAVLLLIPNINFDHVTPILYDGIQPMMKGVYELIAYPLGEVVIFLAVFSCLKNSKSISKIYIRGILIGGLMLFVVGSMIILVLGVNEASSQYFAGYKALERVNIGNFLERIEVIFAITFILGIFIKVSIYLLATCKGFVKLFNQKDYRYIVLPIALLCINLCYFEFDSIMSFHEYISDVYTYAVFPFMIILPIITLFVSKLRGIKST